MDEKRKPYEYISDELIRKQQAIDAMLGDKVEITNVIRAIGNERDFEVLNTTCDRHAEIIKALPSAQPVNDDLIQKIEEGIKATTPTDEYMVGMRNGMRWCKSLLDGKEPEYDTVQSNHDAEPGKMVDDTISRQAAIDALDVLCQEHRYKIPGKAETYSQYNEAWQDALDRAEGAIFNLPPVQPKRGKWIKKHWKAFRCSECNRVSEYCTDFCPNCGADMRTKERDYDYERAVEQLEHDMLYEPTFNQDDGSM